MTQTILTVVGMFALEIVFVSILLYFALRQAAKEIAEEEAREE
jgi:cbb3-type cytochrome oxidase subunit 3